MSAAAPAYPTLSVVMGCRNSAATLDATLGALARQHYPGWWEVVLVDNGSTDDTVEVAARFGDRLPNLSVVANPTPGHQGSGINVGIGRSKGEAIAFLDSDDEVGPGYLTHLGRAMVDAPVVAARIDVERLNPPEVVGRRRPLQADRVDVFHRYLPAVIGAAMGARREAVDAVGGWDPDLPTQHDLDVSWRLHRAGYPAVFVPEAVLHYRYRPTARETFAQEVGYGEGEVAVYRRHRAHGLRRRSVPRLGVAYLRVALALVGVRRPGGTARLATAAGNAYGRLRGSIRYRTCFL